MHRVMLAAARARRVQDGAQYPRRSSAWARRCQSRSTFTLVSRNTGAPSRASSSSRASVPASLDDRAALADHHALLRLALDEHLHLVAQHVVVALGLELLGDHRDRVRELVARRRAAASRAPARRRGTSRAGRSRRRPGSTRAPRAAAPRARRRSASTPSPVRPDSGTYASNSPSSPVAATRAARRSRRWSPRSVLLTTRIFGVSTCCTSSATNRSPGPMAAFASMSRHTTSTSARVARARSLVRSPSSVRGLWMPGVSSSTSCDVGRRAHAADLRARRLRPVGDDRDLGADDPVHQRRLADVGPTDERDEARAERRSRRGRRRVRDRTLARRRSSSDVERG